MAEITQERAALVARVKFHRTGRLLTSRWRRIALRILFGIEVIPADTRNG